MSHRTRVLFLNSCVNGGGAGRSLAAYLSHQASAIDPIVVLPAPGVLAKQLVHDAHIVYMPELLERIQTTRSPTINKIPGINVAVGAGSLARAALKLIDLVRAQKPDVIYGNHMLVKPIGAYVGVRTGVPVVLHARNIHDWPIEKQLFQSLARLDCVKTIICNSRASAVPYAAIAHDKVRVVHNFVDLTRFERANVRATLRRDHNIARDAIVIGFLGRIIGWKGIDLLLRAFAKLAPRAPRAVCVIVGDNDRGLKTDLRASYQALAQSLGVAERVIFTGFRDDVAPYLADFDVLALPSVRPEPFGRVVIEAMALGIAPVIAAHGGAIEVVSHGVNGLWAAPRDVDAFSASLERMVGERELRRRLAQRAAIDVREKLDGHVLAREVTRLIERAASQRRSS